jgi:hypothetical protein
MKGYFFGGIRTPPFDKYKKPRTEKPLPQLLIKKTKNAPKDKIPGTIDRL